MLSAFEFIESFRNISKVPLGGLYGQSYETMHSPKTRSGFKGKQPVEKGAIAFERDAQIFC